MRPEMGETAGEGSPQESAGVPANTRERARKKANRERLTFIYWWRWRELNPRPRILRRWLYMLIRLYCCLTERHPSGRVVGRRVREF